ncbi:hypothetical protein PCE1_000763 [Barthelona sp. PCE]
MSTAAAVQALNPYSEVVKRADAMGVIIAGARGLQEVLKTNLGPRGTLKMLVSGGNEIRITKDGACLLHEMQIQLPTAQIIARAATSQDEFTGDGTTSLIVLIGELMKEAQLLHMEGIHPRIISDGMEIAKKKTFELLKDFSVKEDVTSRENLIKVARTCIRTKVDNELADQLSEIVVDAVNYIKRDDMIDLHMVERMHMKHRTANDTVLVKGLVLDHGSRHPGMPSELENCHVLFMNVSLEYEKTTINSSMVYKTAEKRDELIRAERKIIDDRVRKIIALKREICSGERENHGFVIFNMAGVDSVSLQMLADEGILALRRAKRRNLERFVRSVGGTALRSLDNVTEADLGFADRIREVALGEEKYTFVEGCPKTQSVTILIRGSTNYTIARTKDAIRDGLRAVKNTYDDNMLVPGAGAFEIFAHRELMDFSRTIKGRRRLGVEAFAKALLVIPKTLAKNAGLDAQDTIIAIQDELGGEHAVGVDLDTGKAMHPTLLGIFDNYKVKRHLIQSAASILANLIACDEIIAGGISGRMNHQKQNATGLAGL